MFHSRFVLACLTVTLLAGVAAPELRAADAPAATAKYDMSKFRTLAEDALKAAKAGDFATAQKKTLELESKWDDGTKELKAADRKVWNAADKQMDVLIDACKGEKPDVAKIETAEKDFLAKLAAAEKVK